MAPSEKKAAAVAIKHVTTIGARSRLRKIRRRIMADVYPMMRLRLARLRCRRIAVSEGLENLAELAFLVLSAARRNLNRVTPLECNVNGENRGRAAFFCRSRQRYPTKPWQ